MNKLNDMPLQGTVNRCKAATLVAFFEQGDERIKSVSELTRLTVDALVEILVRLDMVEEITDTAAATRILEKISYGRAYLNADRYASAALRNMQLDAEADTTEFSSLPKFRGRKGKWDASDDAKTRAIIEANLKKRGLSPNNDK